MEDSQNPNNKYLIKIKGRYIIDEELRPWRFSKQEVEARVDAFKILKELKPTFYWEVETIKE